MTLEKALAYVQDDNELVEVTPEAVRIRKRFLDIHERTSAMLRPCSSRSGLSLTLNRRSLSETPVSQRHTGMASGGA